MKKILDIVTCDYFTSKNNVLLSNPVIPEGAVMMFLQNSAPVGWTKLTSGDYANANDAAIIVTDGDSWGNGYGNPSGDQVHIHTHDVVSHHHSYSHNHQTFTINDSFVTHTHLWVGSDPGTTNSDTTTNTEIVASAAVYPNSPDPHTGDTISGFTYPNLYDRNTSGPSVTNTNDKSFTSASSTDGLGTAIKYHTVIFASKDPTG